MQISFEQSGGFAGLTSGITVDTDTLPPEEAARVDALVEEAEFFSLPEKIVSQRPQPDRYQYLLKVDCQGRRHGVMVSEEAVPPRLAPLIKWLQDAVRQKRNAPR